MSPFLNYLFAVIGISLLVAFAVETLLGCPYLMLDISKQLSWYLLLVQYIHLKTTILLKVFVNNFLDIYYSYNTYIENDNTAQALTKTLIGLCQELKLLHKIRNSYTTPSRALL